MIAADTGPWSTSALYAGLRALYPKGSYGLVFEVPDATGFGKSRSADAMAMSLWPSRGLDLIGIEVKASRADWVKELKDPSKADVLARYCDRWYLAIGDRKIVHEGELPRTWGLIAPRAGKLKVVVEAPINATPEPIDRKFLAALFRRVSETFTLDLEGSDEIRKVKAESYQAGLAAGEASMAGPAVLAKIGRLERELKEARDVVVDFEARSGLKLDDWRLKMFKVPEMARLFADTDGLVRLRSFAKYLAQQAEEIGSLSATLKDALDTAEIPEQ